MGRTKQNTITATPVTSCIGGAATQAADAAAIAADALMKESAAMTLVTVASSAQKLHRASPPPSPLLPNLDRRHLRSYAQAQSVGSPTETTTTPHQHEQSRRCYSVLMTTIGLGIDPFFGAHPPVSTNTPTADGTSATGTAPTAASRSTAPAGDGVSNCKNSNNIQQQDATIAAVKAVRDAMERGVLRFPADHSNLQLHIQLGVPPTVPGGTEPMPVNVEYLTPLLPSFIPVAQPVDVVVGGLLVRQDAAAQGSNACTAVACITLKKLNGTAGPTSAPPPALVNNVVTSPTSVAGHTTPVEEASSLLSALQQESQPLAPPMSWAQVEQATMAAPALLVPSKGSSMGYTVQPLVHRSASIDMLAQVSSELHEQPSLAFTRSFSCPAIHNALAARARSLGPIMDEDVDPDGDVDDDDDKPNTASGSNILHYKKLPPGKTPKNNKRIFVQHSYRDYSQEKPLPEELEVGKNSSGQQAAVAGGPTRNPNFAFPLKLHETLALIEAEGYQHIIGWLPHGRSFKIHNQKEFVESILPRYFVMTKKSSFLRQLNLYGFNRLSGIGPDQGSYYHEKFLRGIPFLCRRIHRQKVNGNGIRSAGNPDGEPNLSRFPICPGPPLGAAVALTSTTATNRPALAQAAALLVTTKQRQHRSTSPHGAAAAATTTKAPVQTKASAPKNGSTKFNKPSSAQLTLISSYADRENTQQKQQRQSPQQGPQSSSRDSSPTFKVNSGPHPSFPLKLQRILDLLESQGECSVISWLSHGRAFLVRDVDRFVEELMPRYFNQTKYSSFQRQLHMYHFQRITIGRDKGAYHHPQFQRGHPERCINMHRTRVNGKGTRQPGNPCGEPNLYALTPISPIRPGTVIDIPSDVQSLHPEDDHSHCSEDTA